jgi:tetratricopeptide (TPR) repeat protein
MIRISAAASAGETLVVWLPSASGLPATLVGDSDGAMQRSGSALLAYGAPEDAVTGTLLSYLQAGALEDARTALPALYKLMDEAKTKSPLGPNTLTLAAYILHKLRDVRADEIIRVLLETYPSIPDAYVIVGQRLIRQGKAEEAPAHFDAALAKGVPIYTEGIRLLRDGSNFLRDLNPTHRHLRRNALQANCLASAANFKSELSCLRLGHDVAVEFVEDESSSASDSGARVATVPKGPEGSPLGTPVVSAG